MTIEKIRAMLAGGVGADRGALSRTRTERVILAVEAGGSERDALHFEVGYGPVKLGRVTRRDRPDLWERMRAGELTDSAATAIRLREKRDSGAMVPHPATDLFPELAGEDLERLRASLIEHGYRKETPPVVLHRDGSVIDGRARLTLCRELGIECRGRVYQDEDATIPSFVVERNMASRRLDKGQRAMALARIAGLGNGRPAATTAKGPPEPPPAPPVSRKAGSAGPVLAVGGVSARLKLQRVRAAWEAATPEGREAFLAWVTADRVEDLDGAGWRWPYLASRPGDERSAEAFARRTPSGARVWVRYLADAWAEWLDNVVVYLDEIGRDG